MSQPQAIGIALAGQSKMGIIVAKNTEAAQSHSVIMAVTVGISKGNECTPSQFQVTGIGIGEFQTLTLHTLKLIALNADAVTGREQIIVLIKAVTAFLE